MANNIGGGITCNHGRVYSCAGVMKTELKAFVKPSTFSYGYSAGYGNGYVVIPEGHPLHKMGYDDIHDKYDIDVHGGLTFAEIASGLREWGIPDWVNETDWIIGFDTAHYGDSLQRWPDEESVLSEANRLKEQCERL